MIRSARCARWWGRTGGGSRRAHPAVANAIASSNSFIQCSKEDREPTAVLLEVARVVGVEHGVVAEIEAQGHPLLERQQQTAAGVGGEELPLVDHRLVGLVAAERRPAPHGEE